MIKTGETNIRGEGKRRDRRNRLKSRRSRRKREDDKMGGGLECLTTSDRT